MIKKIFHKTIRKILFKLKILNNPKIILEKFFNQKKNKKFCVQVGANDGIMDDPLRKYLKKQNNYSALLIEPLDYYHKKLLKTYKNREDIKIMKSVISNKIGNKKIYYIDPKIAKLMNGNGPRNNWAHGQGSFSKKFITNQIHINSFRGKTYKENIHRFIDSIKFENVKAIKLSNIKLENNTQNLLVIDVQGFEYEVLKSINFKKQKFHLIYLEDEKFNIIKTKKIQTLLKKNNFKLVGDDGTNYVYAINNFII